MFKVPLRATLTSSSPPGFYKWGDGGSEVAAPWSWQRQDPASFSLQATSGFWCRVEGTALSHAALNKPTKWATTAFFSPRPPPDPTLLTSHSPSWRPDCRGGILPSSACSREAGDNAQVLECITKTQKQHLPSARPPCSDSV